MRQILVILVRPPDLLQDHLISTQRSLPDSRVDVVDLTTGAPDYSGLLESIFASDSVQVL
ncbi:MAG: hypothetical protein AB7O66_02545 [Limisphaerales bacterium]